MVAIGLALSRMGAWKRVWVKPEVYPIVGAVAVGLGAAGYFGYHKLVHDPTVVMSKRLRNAGFNEQFDARPRDIGHMTGLAHVSKNWSTRMLDKHEPNQIHLYNTAAYLDIEKKRIARVNGVIDPES
mmetsp:Transcript_2763/g.6064  ORF Transcript_2763/g.6064 Transcript_2763/m.6064 type:complete len:127 (-) Transcript_2763:558-938(-)|eukprot:CAMPEP_0185848242 /NCGR_PEP_ID=MMETSP1354-20130828/3204_1 /TAXON_ID=708628 /ORGANISM="Erythrolobus madagascarensis, Strain CCMP3276" /LENGTH=126 /DNA_ID=CAMNT_0028548621 /DNA_START=205 /DNA_END=585 /DNA_ORIENTATION=-